MQTPYYILRSCIGAQLTHILRTISSSLTVTFAKFLNNVLYTTIISLANLTQLEKNVQI